MPPTVRQILNDARWELRPVGDLSHFPSAARGPFSARIPGCVHTDLMAAGAIGDPALGMNELDQQWIGLTDWEYACRFEADPALTGHERIDLVCEGLDTIAELTLNGIEIGRAANMFHPHRFDARAALRGGENELVVRFTSPIRHVRAEEARIGARPVNGDWDPYIFIRKAASNFGWDWGPRVATCGIWKPLRLEGWSGVRVAGVRPSTRRTGDGWLADVAVDLAWSGGSAAELPADLAVRIIDRRGTQELSASAAPNPGTSSASVEIPVMSPRIWWPRGMGGQDRYELAIDLRAPGGQDVDRWRGAIGFREVRLKTGADEQGSGFLLEINGREIFCKGANWIPDDLFPAGMDRERYRDRLRRALDANMNMLRVWGGGIYESDEFYDLCDELGILVWQDFMFACAMYPEEPPYPALIEAEARHQITRLSPHPSVALWCGGNECIWAYESWGKGPGETTWKERLGAQTWGRGYYLDLLPRLVRELDPSRPYWANSPWSGSESSPSNDVLRGDRHTWEVRGDGYRTLVPRFCSEFGHQSPANISTFERAIGRERLTPGSQELQHRQRATGGTARHIDEAIAESFRLPRTFDEWHYLAQLNQARALQTGIEWLRIHQPRCMGALVWQLNDAWPGMSWSLIDSDGGRKPAYRAVGDAFANRILSIQPVDGRLGVYAVNDTDEPWEHRLDLQRLGFGGTTLTSIVKRRFAVPPRSVACIADVEADVGAPADPAREFILAATFNQRRTWFYLPDKELAYPEPVVEFGPVQWGRGGGTAHATARTLLRDLTIAEDRVEGTRIVAAVPHRTVLPGEAFSLTIRSELKIDEGEVAAERLFSPPILWCANWFGLGT